MDSHEDQLDATISALVSGLRAGSKHPPDELVSLSAPLARLYERLLAEEDGWSRWSLVPFHATFHVDPAGPFVDAYRLCIGDPARNVHSVPLGSRPPPDWPDLDDWAYTFESDECLAGDSPVKRITVW